MANNPLMEALMAAGLIKGGGNAANPTGNPASTLPMPTFQQGNDGTITKTMPSGTPYAVTKDDARYGRVSQEAAAAQQQSGGIPVMAQQMQMNPGSGGYGHEVARPTGEQALAGLISSIQAYRKDNPMQQPFPAGTPTLQAREFEERQKQNVFENQLNSAKFSLSASKGSGGSSSGGSRSGGSSTAKPTATERKNAILNSLIPDILLAKNNGFGQNDVYNDYIGDIGDLGGAVSPADLSKLIEGVYVNGGGDTGGIFGGISQEEQRALDEKKAQQEAIDSRPWWHKAIDTVIPGAQFR